MKAVLVTGGAGYVGSHACKALAAAGYTPVSFDNLHRGRRSAVKWGPLVEGDILDRAALDSAFAAHRPVAVMHFAALAYVGESVQQPALYFRNNVGGSLNVIEAACDHGRVPIVFSSTCATYGVPARALIAESDPQLPVNPYGASKLMVERMLADIGRANGLRSIALRYFNAAGADPDGETGECHDPETHLIPLVLQAAADSGAHVTIHGDTYPTPDGTCVRDYIHVSDLASAHVLALDALLGGHTGGAYNLGTGQGHSVREVIDAARRVTGRTVNVQVGHPRPGDPPTLVAAIGRAREDLGWVPKLPALDDIVATAWKWHQLQWAGSAP